MQDAQDALQRANAAGGKNNARTLVPPLRRPVCQRRYLSQRRGPTAARQWLRTIKRGAAGSVTFSVTSASRQTVLFCSATDCGYRTRFVVQKRSRGLFRDRRA